MGTLTFNAIGDTYIKSRTNHPRNPNTVNEYRDVNYGGGNQLYVNSWVEGNSAESQYNNYERMIIQFDFSAQKTLLSTKKVRTAYFKIRRQGGAAAETNAYRLSYFNAPSNLEYSVTYDSWENSYNSALLYGDFHLWQEGEYLYIDITELLLEYLNNGSYFLLYFSNTAVYGTYYSKESGSPPQVVVTYDEIIPNTPTDLMPDGVVIRKEAETVLSWTYNGTENIGQKKFEVAWRMVGTEVWNANTITSTNQYYTIEEDTFSIGTVEWRVRTWNTYDNVSGYGYAYFEVIGESEAPIVQSVTNESMPVITWTAEYQDIYEIQIYSGGKRIYESGLIAGANVFSHQVNIPLMDGNYELRIRIINTFGVPTDWTAYTFVLDTSNIKPEVPNAKIYMGNYSIHIESDSDGTLYAIRRALGEKDWTVLGELADGQYIDISGAPYIEYEYAVRAYDGGYADSKAEVFRLGFQDACISTESGDHVLLEFFENVEDSYSVALGKEYTLLNFVGRKYPVIEFSGWLSKEFSIRGIVSLNDYHVIEKIHNECLKAYLRYGTEAYLCDIGNAQGDYIRLFDMYLVSLTVTKIDEGGG